MKKIRSSFIGKLFFSLILLYFIVFLFLFVFQGIIFRTYYTSRTIKSVRSEISRLKSKEDFDDIKIEELLFSRNTQTITSIFPASSISDDYNILNLYVLDIEMSNGTIQILAPKGESIEYTTGQEIIATTIVSDGPYEIPTHLIVDNKTIIRSDSISDEESFISIFDGLNISNQHDITGVITSVSTNVTDGSINSLISNEILNITSANYFSLVNLEDGFYYFTFGADNISPNLVFFSTLEINNENHILISVYQMDHVDEIVAAAGTANVYMFVVVLFILIASSFIYSREFSKPLLFINRATKELSQLKFDSPLIEVKSTDEFAELATNINTLSVNLKTTLYRLNEQNKQLSNNLDKENNIETKRLDFVRGMSHELKTPLAVIQASAEALQKNIYDTEIDRNNALETIQKEVSKTNSMLKNMMNVYKVDIPNYETEWNIENIKKIIEDVNDSLELLYRNSNQKVIINAEDLYVNCNRNRMETVISNLFTNAIKYTPRNGKIDINLYSKEEYVIFEITNTGTTIPTEEHTKLFEPFYRVDKARSRKEGSSGLGLYIVSQTLEQYNTKCEVHSTNTSVTFSFKLKKVANPVD